MLNVTFVFVQDHKADRKSKPSVVGDSEKKSNGDYTLCNIIELKFLLVNVI